MEIQELELMNLKAQYKMLSELESMFPTTSKHTVLLFIKRKMNQIISVIEVESQSQKDEFISNYLQKEMKNHNLPHGKAYYNLLAEKCDIAEKLWQKKLKSKKQQDK
jgi:hypothetical protein